MSFSKPLYIDEENVILQAAVPLRQKEIDMLAKWDVKEVFTEGKLIRLGSGPETTETRSNPRYLDWIKTADEIFKLIKKKKEVSHNSIDDITAQIILETDNNDLLHNILLQGDRINKLAANAINCAVLAAIIGKNMKILQFRLAQLISGTLLHDVGLLEVPEEILHKKEKLTVEERNRIKTHPLLGYNIILNQLKYTEEIANIALFHQERWDGQGYPRRLKEEDIPLGARIVAVAESYEAMVNKRAYRNQIIGYKAIKNILSDNGRRFDPKILKVFINIIGIHPLGSLVLLNNSSIGKVIEIDRGVPLRPKLKIIIDEYGNRLNNDILMDLKEEKELFIAKPIDPSEVPGTIYE